MALLPTAVTVVTAAGPEAPAGATANAVTSLSLDPPLMLACLDHGSRTLDAVRLAGHFGVSVLARGQEEIARRFASKASQAEKFSAIALSEREGVPLLADSVAWVSCRLRELIPGGDHEIAIGEVLAAGGTGGEPMIFHLGEYWALERSADRG
jgi:flavin reductase (DIM6/NTAB) family NADH-FMN oxidoreductase RutF